MKVLQRGHRYQLDHLEGVDNTIIQFVNKEPGQEHEGVTTQEILRMLIDRTHYCHNCLPHRVNEQIIWHFRMAIALHEARALEQQVAKGEVRPEFVALATNGHFKLNNKPRGVLEEFSLKPVPRLGSRTCDFRSHLSARDMENINLGEIPGEVRRV